MIRKKSTNEEKHSKAKTVDDLLEIKYPIGTVLELKSRTKTVGRNTSDSFLYDDITGMVVDNYKYYILLNVLGKSGNFFLCVNKADLLSNRYLISEVA